ncbi:MAG: hypothetical protein KAV87_13360 [Desulfobacteraceae bacterium]|nr:hypothetical protein [Desulfobacteraceae bacterium]
MPVCPYCSHDITTLFSNSRRNLVWYDEKWLVDVSDGEVTIVCSACYEELGPKDLDKLGVPDELRYGQ